METEGNTAQPKSKVATWTNVVAWIVATLMTFVFFGTVERDRGDGFGDIGFLMVGVVGIGSVFLAGFLPSLVRFLKNDGDPDYRRGFIVACVVLAVLIAEFAIVYAR